MWALGLLLSPFQICGFYSGPSLLCLCRQKRLFYWSSRTLSSLVCCWLCGRTSERSACFLAQTFLPLPLLVSWFKNNVKLLEPYSSSLRVGGREKWCLVLLSLLVVTDGGHSLLLSFPQCFGKLDMYLQPLPNLQIGISCFLFFLAWI